MDVLREFFDDHSGELTHKLESSGFSIKQARAFLPEAVESILKSTQNTGIAHAISGLLDDPSQLIGSMNTDAIAKKLSMKPERVAKGFAVIIPVLSQAFSYKSNGVLKSFDGGSVVNIMSSARKLFI